MIFGAKEGHIDFVRTLLYTGADFNEKNYNDETALIVAAIEGHRDIVETLLDKGADVNIKNIKGYTAFVKAAQEGRTYTLQTLLAREDIDINKKGLCGETDQDD